MEYVNIVLISVSIFLISKVIISRISSNKPPRALIKAASENRYNMKIVEDFVGKLNKEDSKQDHQSDETVK